MASKDKVVLRFISGKLLKGYLREFSTEAGEILFEEVDKGEGHNIPVRELKAIFFVRSFEGDKTYKESKRYGKRKPEGKRIFIKFKDDEIMIGYLQGDIPWKKGFFISKPDEKKAGFFLVPADEDCNNIKVFVVGSSIKDITVVP